MHIFGTVKVSFWVISVILGLYLLVVYSIQLSFCTVGIPLCVHFASVLRVHDILLWIRILICGSKLLTNGSGSSYFRHWPSRGQQKTNLNKSFFALPNDLDHLEQNMIKFKFLYLFIRFYFNFVLLVRLGVPNGPAAAAEPPSPIGGYQQVVASGQAGGSVTLASSGGQGGGGGEPLNRILNALSNRGLLSQQNGKFYYVGGEKGAGGGGASSSNSVVSSTAATVTTGLTFWKFKEEFFWFFFLSTYFIQDCFICRSSDSPCVGGRWDGIQDNLRLRHWLSGALTTRLNLIDARLNLILESYLLVTLVAWCRGPHVEV